MQTDKRRYISKANTRKDKATVEHGTGNAGKDGFSVRYRHPMPREDPYGPKDSLYSERYQCEGLMDDDEARMERLYPTTGEDT